MNQHTKLRDYSALKLEAFKLFEEGYKCKEIATILSLDRHNVGRWLRKAGYEYSKVNKAKINSAIFDIIDNEEKAYWLGFLFADGYVSRNTEFELSLGLKDVLHLEKFKKFLSYEGRIYIDNKIGRCRLQFGDPQIVSSLKQKGCVNKKSLILEFPTEESVPSKLIRHFIRGYFDGDGSIGKPEMPIDVSILGTLPFLEKFNKTASLLSANIIHKDKRHHHLVFISEFCGDNARNFCKYIYTDATIYLERKYNRYLKHLDNNTKWGGGTVRVEILNITDNTIHKFDSCLSACKYMKCTHGTLMRRRTNNTDKLINKKFRVLKHGQQYKKPSSEGVC